MSEAVTTGQLPNESAKAFAAFREYCEQGAQRSHDAVSKKLRKSIALISRWSRTYGWTKRVALYDHEQRELGKSADEKAAEAVALQRQQRKQAVQDSAWEMFEQLRNKAREMLAFPVGRREVREKHEDGKDKITIIEPTRWRFSDLAKMIEVADGLGRLANDMVTGGKRVELTGKDGVPLPPSTSVVAPVISVVIEKTEETTEIERRFHSNASRR